MKNEIFNRIEKKYILTRDQIPIIRNEILKNMAKDKYDKYTICNIYFDNDTNTLVRTSLDKPVYKEKLRLRSYGTPSNKDKIYFEIKKKYKKIVNKRRISLLLKDYKDYTIHGINENLDSQVFREIDYMIKKYDLKPFIYLAYDREAYISKIDSSFRLTLDFNIRWRNKELGLEYGDYGNYLFPNHECIMEIKCVGGYPLWLVNILNKLKIYPSSFSKVGNVYKQYLKEECI